MEKFAVILALAIPMAFSAMAGAEDTENGAVVLYQIGHDGKYCVSMTKDESGCVSGSHPNGDAINTLKLLKDRKVVFYNLSDAPHDMRFSGKNADDLPTQQPGASAAMKQMTVEDLMKNKITCSFHGSQLEVGFKVLPKENPNAMTGHQQPGADGETPTAQKSTEMANRGAEMGGGAGMDTTPEPVIRTGLADVSAQVLAKGRPDDVERLLQARPELMDGLKAVRPLLAKELVSKSVAEASAGGRGDVAPSSGKGRGFAYDTKPGSADSALGSGVMGDRQDPKFRELEQKGIDLASASDEALLENRRNLPVRRSSDSPGSENDGMTPTQLGNPDFRTMGPLGPADDGADRTRVPQARIKTGSIATDLNFWLILLLLVASAIVLRKFVRELRRNKSASKPRATSRPQNDDRILGRMARR